MKTHRFFTAFLAAAATLAACRDNEFTTVPTPQKSSSTRSLVGTWQEAEWAGPRFAWNTYRISLDSTDGGYRIAVSVHTDAVDPTGTCAPERIEWSTGAWSATADSIFFAGTYTDSTYASTRPTCDSKAIHALRVAYTLTADSLILHPANGDPYFRTSMYRD